VNRTLHAAGIPLTAKKTNAKTQLSAVLNGPQFMKKNVSAPHDILLRRRATTSECLDLFDSLASVDVPFMIGRWKGYEITTGHPQDGILEATRWYGKEFVDSETVHPLLHLNGRGELFRVQPRPMVVALSLRLPFLKRKLLWPLSRLMTQLLKTHDSQARVRMVEYRGIISATMIYDHLPINDHFHMIDDDTVLGLMDFKGYEPYFFVLQRDKSMNHLTAG